MRRLEQAAIWCAPAVFVVLWSTGFIGSKYGLPYAEPFTFLTLRMLLVVAILGVVLLVTRPVWPNAAGLGHSAVTGMLMHGLYLGGVFVAINRGLPAALTALIVGLQPVLTSTLANRLLGERVLPRQWLGLAIGLAGVFLIVRGNITGGAGAPAIAWIASTVALIGITAGTLYQRRFGGNIDWRCGFLFQYGAAGVMFVIGAFALEKREVNWDPHFIGALAWMVLVLSLGAIWLLYFLIRRSAATRVVSLFYLTPPVTALMAWAMFGDKLDFISLAGMAACAAGVFLVNWRTQPK
jgi:drug/metabolite transporter (DMT)-like permease